MEDLLFQAQNLNFEWNDYLSKHHSLFFTKEKKWIVIKTELNLVRVDSIHSFSSYLIKSEYENNPKIVSGFLFLGVKQFVIAIPANYIKTITQEKKDETILCTNDQLQYFQKWSPEIAKPVVSLTSGNLTKDVMFKTSYLIFIYAVVRTNSMNGRDSGNPNIQTIPKEFETRSKAYTIEPMSFIYEIKKTESLSKLFEKTKNSCSKNCLETWNENDFEFTIYSNFTIATPKYQIVYENQTYYVSKSWKDFFNSKPKISSMNCPVYFLNLNPSGNTFPSIKNLNFEKVIQVGSSQFYNDTKVFPAQKIQKEKLKGSAKKLAKDYYTNVFFGNIKDGGRLLISSTPGSSDTSPLLNYNHDNTFWKVMKSKFDNNIYVILFNTETQSDQDLINNKLMDGNGEYKWVALKADVETNIMDPESETKLINFINELYTTCSESK